MILQNSKIGSHFPATIPVAADRTILKALMENGVGRGEMSGSLSSEPYISDGIQDTQNIERLLRLLGSRAERSTSLLFSSLFPQIAIAIAVLTSNRGEGDEPLWRIGRGTRVPLQGAVDVVPLLGAIVGCHCSVLWLRGRVTTNFGGADVVPLLGAIAGCHCSVLWWGEGRATTNFGGAGGAIAGCHCRVPL